MISEGSCDTEDWSNDAEIKFILQYVQIENLSEFIIMLEYCCIFDQINAAWAVVQLWTVVTLQVKWRLL